MSDRPGPVLIDLEAAAPGVTPSEAPPVLDSPAAPPTAAAMQRVAQLAARPRSRLARWFWSLLGAIIGFAVSIAAWDFVTGLLARNAVLGWVAVSLFGLFLGVLFLIALREWSAFARLARLDAVHLQAEAAIVEADLGAARQVTDRLVTLYSGRAELEWPLTRLKERRGDVFDADGLLGLVEAEVLAPLDAMAKLEVQAAARQVAMVTAVVPLALADVAVALTANLRMIRRVAEVYGGRAGTLGSLRLMRSVMTHLVATGAVAVGDDMLGSIGGGHLLTKLSRRFGEGIVNGALTARVGVAAMEVCRPLPFRVARRPSVTGLVQRALTGLFGS